MCGCVCTCDPVTVGSVRLQGRAGLGWKGRCVSLSSCGAAPSLTLDGWRRSEKCLGKTTKLCLQIRKRIKVFVWVICGKYLHKSATAPLCPGFGYSAWQLLTSSAPSGSCWELELGAYTDRSLEGVCLSHLSMSGRVCFGS